MPAGDAHSLNVWLGGGGATSSCHYDASLNLFMQLHGVKRFLLGAPRAARLLRPYSFLHPHFRRAQRPPDDAAVRSEADEAGWWSEAVLAPGDLLLLPPFWFHHVTAVSALSLSINLWASVGAVPRAQRLVGSGAAAFALHNVSGGLLSSADFPALAEPQRRAALMEEAATALVRVVMRPPHHHHRRRSAADAARAHAAHLADPRAAVAWRWLHEEMGSRWREVAARYPRPLAKLATFCAPAHARARRLMWARALRGTQAADEAAAAVDAAAAAAGGGDDGEDGGDADSGDALSELLPLPIRQAVATAAATLRALPAGADELELGNLLEQASLEVLGGEARVAGSFLLHCFRDADATTQPDEDEAAPEISKT